MFNALSDRNITLLLHVVLTGIEAVLPHCSEPMGVDSRQLGTSQFYYIVIYNDISETVKTFAKRTSEKRIFR